jgi:YVTN family beta-propeller protein
VLFRSDRTYGIAVHPNGSRVYVANWSSNDVSVIDTATNLEVLKIPVGNRPVACGTFILPAPPTANAGPPQAVHAGDAVTLDGSNSTDPDGLLPLTYAWSFLSLPVGSEAVLTGPTTVNPTFTADIPGDYVVQLIVTNNWGRPSTPATVTISTAIGTPSPGFVNGGGWMESPAGAYKADPSMTGKATFRFVSQYPKGAPVPAGKTAFQFTTGNLRFQSRSYDWLVLNEAGRYAQFQGTGTVNGTGGYKFMVRATDNGRTGDTLRMRIWNASTDEVLYDNDVKQPIGCGQILVHAKKR